jgi:outer membrane protein insertion porin family
MNFFAKAYVEETLEADIIGLREVYRDYGYLDAIVELERLEFSDDRHWVTIYLAIDEGERYVVGDISIQGLEMVPDPQDPARIQGRPAELLFPEEELLELLELRPGEVYEERRRRADERVLGEKYGQLGHLDHPTIPQTERWQFLEPELSFDEEGNEVDVTYLVVQGKQQFIREVLVRGNLHTQDRVIRRLITIEPGQVADPGEITRSRARIQGTGYFSSQRRVLEHREPTYRFIQTEDPSWKDLEFVVEEGETLTFSVSGGISSNSGAFGLITLTQRNFDATDLPSSPWRVFREVADRRAFHGAGQELRIVASPGTEVSYFDVMFREPDIFKSHIDRVSLTLNARKRLRQYESHDEERDVYGFELGRQITPDSAVFAGYSFGNVEIDDIFEGGEPSLGQPLSVPKLLKDQEGESDLGWVEGGYRLRTTDSPMAPRNGLEFGAVTKYYGEGLGSDFEFVKAEVNWSWYFEIDPESPQASDRVRMEVTSGVAVPFGDTEDVPYSERFFLGGQNSLRGFDFRGVGPNEFGFPLGGETMLSGTIEYRRPLVTTTQPGTYREIETLHMGLFFDAGVLDPEAFSLNSDELRASVGFLFGLSVPLPISFSFGYPIAEGDGDDKRTVGFDISLY